MKTKEEHIEFWTEQAEDDWSAVHALLNAKKYIQAMFFAHLVIEKICKALWIKCNESNLPPKSHNLIYLLSATRIEPTENQKEFMLNLNRFQLEGRYPEYRTKMNKICTKDFTTTMINQTNELRQWLLSQLL